MLSEEYLEEQLKLVGSDNYLRSILKSHIEAVKKLESVVVLCVEGIEFMTRTEMAEAILEEIEKET